MKQNKLGILIVVGLVIAFFSCVPVIPFVDPTTPVEVKTTVNLLSIPGITAPAVGAAYVGNLETSQYTGTISWSPSIGSGFMPNTIYTATITLSPKEGFTLTGVMANSFTVAGAITTNGVSSGVVKAVFPSTAIRLAMVSVPGGTFYNGVANMTVSGFSMSQYEIKGTEYAAVMGVADPSSFSGVNGHPVDSVCWYEALVFCNKLSMAEGLTPVYRINGSTNPAAWGAIPTTGYDVIWNAVIANWNANGYRLPTEMEWMWAALGGASDSRSGDIVGAVNTGGYSKGYAGSTENSTNQINIGNYAWYDGNSNGTTHQVGNLLNGANELGLYDMSGNVWELCWDNWGDYPYAQTDYRGASSGPDHLMRGGGFDSIKAGCTVSFRNAVHPSTKANYLGFRVVRK